MSPKRGTSTSRGRTSQRRTIERRVIFPFACICPMSPGSKAWLLMPDLTSSWRSIFFYQKCGILYPWIVSFDRGLQTINASQSVCSYSTVLVPAPVVLYLPHIGDQPDQNPLSCCMVRERQTWRGDLCLAKGRPTIIRTHHWVVYVTYNTDWSLLYFVVPRSGYIAGLVEKGVRSEQNTQLNSPCSEICGF